MTLKIYKFKELGQVITGKTPPTSQNELYGNDYPFITPSDIPTFSERYIFQTERGLSVSGRNKMKSIILPRNSICVVCIGSTIGKICLTHKNESITNQQLNSIKVANEKFDAMYLYYAIRNYIPKIQAVSGGTGAGKAILNKSSFEELEIELLENKQIQNKIAKILSNYDDLIENNNKRIKILEEMVQKIYKEWFVDFKYPGHETATFKDTELGKIPSDWELKTLDNFCNIFTGKKNANAASNNGMYNFFTCAPEPLTINTYIYDGAAVIIAGNGSYTGRTQFFNGKFDLYQRTYACTLQDGYDEYLMYALFMTMKEKFEKKTMGGMHGAAIPYIVYDDIAKYSFAYNDNIFTTFSMIMKPYLESIFLLKKKNIRLKQIRDILLPRLMSGEIDVEGMEIA